MMKRLEILLIVTVLFLMPRGGFPLGGDDILKRAEVALNAPKDRKVKEKMVLVKADGSKKERTILFYQKGSDKRLVIFLSPADIKGVGFLSLSEDRMYLYLPAFRKIRRIASHIKNEDFMGTDFSYEDIAETEFSDEYSAVLEKEGSKEYILELKPLPNADVSYSRLRMWVDKETFIPAKTEYFSKGGKLIKRLTSESIKNVDGYWFPRKETMETIKSGHRTILKVLEIKHDQGLSDRFFTQRNLKRQAR